MITSSTLLSKSGAAITSTNCLFIILSASLESSFLLKVMIPPNAEVGSVLYALLYASSKVLDVATPHGLACFTITQDGELNCSTQENALSVSTRLLNERALPDNCT